LCADALGIDLKPATRATVLATVAMARHALGQPAREPLEEALALDRTLTWSARPRAGWTASLRSLRDNSAL
jgi:hypothetical protein